MNTHDQHHATVESASVPGRSGVVPPAGGLCTTCRRPFDAPEHHPDLIALSAQDGGEREALDQERDDRRAWMRAALDLQAVVRRERARADAAEAALAARPAPTMSAADHDRCEKAMRGELP